MSGLPEFFEQTSNEPYDRHHYRLVLTDGRSVEFDDWQTVAAQWFKLPAMFTQYIDVLDKPKARAQPKGF